MSHSKLQQRIAHAQCPKGGIHDWECSWPGPEQYIQTCKKCGLVEDLDPYIGLGKVEHTRCNRATKYKRKTES